MGVEELDKKISEASLYPIIGAFLTERSYKVAYEVPVGRFHPRIFDVVGIKGEELISVEAKVNDFPRALQQAVTRLYYSDKVFVAFPEKYALHVSSSYSGDLKTIGVGLLSVDGEVTEKMKAKESTYLNAKRKKMLIAKAVLQLK
jgi:hypothetical protein